ncbi:MAG: hypothetical protein KDA72_10725, partial [Planctomycetales bacterium]|nr:hypothetical protein [Planctomycetales bacterium]
MIELIVYPSQVARFSVGKRSIAVATASIDTRKAHFLQAWGHNSRLGADTKKTRTVDEATGGHYLKSGDKLSTSSYKVMLTDKFAVLPHLSHVAMDKL